MIKQPFIYPSPILKEKMPDVPRINGRIRRIIQDLKDTMFATNAIGYAANQLGYRDNVCIVSDFTPNHSIDKVWVLVNPEIVGMSEETTKGIEGCKSLPGFWAWIDRPAQIEIRHLNGVLTLSDYHARVAEHEIDHLNGVLLPDKVKLFNTKVINDPFNFMKDWEAVSVV